VNSDDKRAVHRSIDWGSPRLIVALAAIGVAILAVPAWAGMDDGGDPTGEHARVAPAPMPGPMSGMPAPPPDGAAQRDAIVVPAPPVPDGSGTPQRNAGDAAVPGGR
jgi:hypothetical protein